jgi:hypothetical protein
MNTSNITAISQAVFSGELPTSKPVMTCTNRGSIWCPEGDLSTWDTHLRHLAPDLARVSVGL